MNPEVAIPLAITVYLVGASVAAGVVHGMDWWGNEDDALWAFFVVCWPIIPVAVPLVLLIIIGTGVKNVVLYIRARHHAPRGADRNK